MSNVLTEDTAKPMFYFEGRASPPLSAPTADHSQWVSQVRRAKSALCLNGNTAISDGTTAACKETTAMPNISPRDDQCHVSGERSQTG